ncbi:1-pyrroline-5-carboxylate dehydrogenase [Desulfococcus multivorans]|uniref:L-glutamate gamma-semialdehyde dehydrogenase n=2 Tax=Desulfococcus multivorans TaxID=897 RepID=S7UZF0_DESML|nr:L-glutamate gamma-semialdehyde dehydrogenase [Desulfococcus multivorans]AOY58281.1 RocA1: 1-pyrroline-5-carboxylate dehydrogenase [Desulfococcus multivorans]AQV00622.1 1-pyrroline-5-carboxylate dehydrogenase [Desulfococcus multivorans]EPR37778.1 delta-1-pyrroline-5-carboxylate dehydrogenase [Desulfococcus multivorans DSM 2059]SJZ98036.1 delta-1-pyrroline-5-carboxylate dehydrogenase [Desulfococcus multivorans DSM 2059]
MSNGVYRIMKPCNEAVPGYLPGSDEKRGLKVRLAELKQSPMEIPLIIGGKEVRSGKTGKCIIPHNHAHVLATYHMAGEAETRMAVQAALDAGKAWAETPWDHRLAVFLRAAEMIRGPWRHTLNAATMLGQSKTVYEADADAACELMDFFRYNSYFFRQIIEEQPECLQGILNRMEYRPLEGFVFAVTPFNFTAIGGNLPGTPAMAGNTVVWKPASTAVYSNYHVMKLLQAAGLPDGVINFIPGPGSAVGPLVMSHSMLAGIHFTGSTAVFQGMWRTVAQNLAHYNGYPRIVGETGGKNFVFAHPSADIETLVPALIGGAFSYQGQKCSATSRVYIPKSIWPAVKTRLTAGIDGIKTGDVEDFTHYMGAVIDRNAFDNISGYIRFAREADDAEIIAGGECDDSIGFFITPTVIVTTDPKFKTMQEEIFGPVMTVFVYPDDDIEKALTLCATTSKYALTGALFARDRAAVVEMERRLCYSAGNLYINDKTTGAFVGLQPFGGARASGTNDKAGSRHNVMRWLSPRTIKENFSPATDYRYGLMQES